MKKVLLLLVLCSSFNLKAQNHTWQSFIDSIPTLSSPRACDLNNDGIKDIVIGGGTDAVFSNNGVMAFDGVNGNLLWKRAARNEVFGSAIFQDITNDGIQDVFIAGRQAQLLAINGSNGQLIWDYFPYNTNPADSGLYNFYHPQFISDVNNDGINDLLVANGGDHAAPDWQTDRPPGHIMVISGSDGSLIAKGVVPDSAETYCSPILADIQNNGNKWILYGTGGENLGGSFWACPLNDLLINQTLSNSIQLVSSFNKGFIAPASLYQTNSGTYDILIQGFDGRVTKIIGNSWNVAWNFALPNTESSAAPVIGNFSGADLTPDVYVSLFKGISPSYTDFYQVMLDGETGMMEFKDSLGNLGYTSGNAIDLNNDGRDEAIASLTYLENGAYKNKIQVIDFQNSQVYQLGSTYTGVNLGSTPFFGNIDSDNQLELVFATKRDSTNPAGWKGIYVRRVDLPNTFPNAGIAWGSYMSSKADGVFSYLPINCGQGSILASLNVSNPSCNGLSTGQINPIMNNTSGPLTYFWSTGQTTTQLQNISAGNYWLHVTNANGCYEYRNVNVNDPYILSFGGISPPTCPGGTNGMATVNSTGCPCQFNTCQFLWENGITTKPNNQLVSGWNQITITHPDGCVVVDSVFVQESLPVVANESIDHVTCFGGSDGRIELVSDPSLAPQNFDWSNGDTTNQITNLNAGYYTVIVSDSRNCLDTLEFQITQNPKIEFAYSSEHISCFGLENGLIQIDSVYGGIGFYTHYLNNSTFSNQVNNLATGNYQLWVKDLGNCCSDTISFSLTQPTELQLVLTATAATTNQSLDGTALASISGGTPPYIVTWNDLNSQEGNLAVYLNPGWYTSLVTDANGCEVSDSVYVELIAGMTDLKKSNLFIFPNPMTDQLFISQVVENVKILDLSGRLVLESKQTDSLYLKGLSPGKYLASIETPKGKLILPFSKL
jgi:hypothetical protein